MSVQAEAVAATTPSSASVDTYWAEHQKMEEMIAAERERSQRGGDLATAQHAESTPKKAPKPPKRALHGAPALPKPNAQTAPLSTVRQGAAPPPRLPTPPKIPLSPGVMAPTRKAEPEPEPEPEVPEGVPPQGEDEDAELGTMAAAADLARAHTQLLDALSDADWPAAEALCLQVQVMTRAANESQGYAAACDPSRVLSASWGIFPLHAALITGAPPSLLPLILEVLELPRELLVAAVALLCGDGAAASRAYGNLSGAIYTTTVVAEGVERARALSTTMMLVAQARAEYDVAGLVEACAQACAVVRNAWSVHPSERIKTAVELVICTASG
jgi:hypothetical protein